MQVLKIMKNMLSFIFFLKKKDEPVGTKGIVNSGTRYQGDSQKILADSMR